MADVVTAGGKAQAAGYLTGTVSLVSTYYGNVGTGSGTASSSDTSLFSEVATTRIAITPMRSTTTTVNDTANYFFIYTATQNITITNAGYFTAQTGGTLMQKSDFSGIPMANQDQLEITFSNQQV